MFADVSTNAVCFSGYLQDISFYKLLGSISSVRRAWLWSEISSSGPTTVVAMVPKTGDWILFSTGCHIYQMGIPIITSYVYFDKGISASPSILIFLAYSIRCMTRHSRNVSPQLVFFSIPITYITYVLKIKEQAGKETLNTPAI